MPPMTQKMSNSKVKLLNGTGKDSSDQFTIDSREAKNPNLYKFMQDDDSKLGNYEE